MYILIYKLEPLYWDENQITLLSENAIKTATGIPRTSVRPFRRRIPKLGSANGTLRGHGDDGWDWQPDVDRGGVARQSTRGGWS